MRRLFILVRWVAGIFAFMLLVGWLVLESTLFVDFRRSFAGKVLTTQIGQKITVNDDARLRLGRESQVFIAGLEIPSETIAGVNLAELDTGSLEIDLWQLVTGAVDIDNLQVTGLHINLLTTADGTNSWTERATTPQTTKNTLDSGNGSGLLGFLTSRTVGFNDISLTIKSDVTGFEFDFVLETLNVGQQQNGTIVNARALGTINDQPFQVDGTFPRGKPFSAAATFGAVQMNIDGNMRPDSGVFGYDADLSIDVSSVGDTLDMLKLDHDTDGTLTLKAGLSGRPGTIGINDLATRLVLTSGQSFKATGSIENLIKMEGLDVLVNALFQPPDTPVKKATSLKELRITEINTQILSSDLGGVKNRNLIVKTNYIDQEFNTVGPISIGQIKRTADGKLSLNDIDLQIGPDDAPFVIAKGDIRDILEFNGVEFEGQLAASADVVLKTLGPKQVQEFGSVHADFEISDASGNLGLTHMQVRTENSDLWSLSADVSVANVAKLGDMALQLDLAVTDGARFLSALNLEPVNTGKVGLSVTLSGSGASVSTDTLITVGGSQIDVTLANTGDAGKTVLRGGLASKRIDIDDLANVTSAGVQLRKMKSLGKRAAKADAPVVKPLIIEPEIKPLMIEKDIKLVDPMKMLKELDLEFGIHVDRLLGQPGLSGIDSDLEIKKGIMQLGPLEATFAGGYFNANARMDLVNAPNVLNVSGATSGWDFGEILDAIGLGIQAHGKIEGRFDLTGNISSAKQFLNSMTGTATVFMTNGNIATSLIELSGLGIFPWLFSKELQQGYTDIVCTVAPMRFEPGRAFSSSIVVETKSVQLVVKGIADWHNDTISVRAEPRPVGRPLARSAWPFVVTGKLSQPDFKLLIGGVAAKPAAKTGEASGNTKPRTPCSVN